MLKRWNTPSREEKNVKKEKLLSDENRRILGLAVLTILVVEVVMFMALPFNLVRIITTTITLLYGTVWLFADIKHGIHEGSEYNKKSVIFDIVILIVEAVVIAAWAACDMFLNTGIAVANIIGVIALVATVLVSIMKS